MDGKVRRRECEVENCYDQVKHINGNKWANKCLFHYKEGENNV